MQVVNHIRSMIEAGALKPADLMDACLERIAAREPEIHAFAASLEFGGAHEGAQ